METKELLLEEISIVGGDIAFGDITGSIAFGDITGSVRITLPTLVV